MDMQDYELKILEEYQVNVKSTRKTRGAFFCDTEEGFLLLREAGMSKKRIPALYKLYAHLQGQGYERVDQLLPNREGEYVSVSEEGVPYVLKYWFRGRECDIRKSRELQDGAKNLAGLHQKMKLELEEYVPNAVHLRDEYTSHNRELKKVRRYMRSRTAKGEFELAFLQCFDSMYEWANASLARLADSGYEELYARSLKENCLTHGDYNYHNILVTPDGLATTNFEHFRRGIQAEDLYYFLRKAMEKHEWNVKLGDCILNAYCAVRPLSDEEMEYLMLRFAYPEKFWKIADSYYRSNKAWIPVKNVEKLKVSIMQTEEKRYFLEQIFAFHL